MPWISDWKPSDPMQVLVYGVSKIGKTRGALTFPRPVVMDFDHGVATARNPDFVAKFGLRKIFYEHFDEKGMKKGVAYTHNALDDSCRFFDEWMKPKGVWKGMEVGRDQFDTWVIDSGTTLSELAQHKAIIIMGKLGLSKTQEKGIVEGLIVPKQQDYGSERSIVEQFVDMVNGSGKNVVLICHEKQITDDNGNVTAIVPLLTGKSSESVPLKFDEVYNLRIEKKGLENVRYLQTEADGMRKVGSRYGIPNKTVWEYDVLKKIIDDIHKKQSSQIEPVVKQDTAKAASQSPVLPGS